MEEEADKLLNNPNNNSGEVEFGLKKRLLLTFSNPKELIRRAKQKSSIPKSILFLVIFTEILVFIGGISTIFFTPEIPGFEFLKTLSIFLFIIGIFIFPIMVLIGSFIVSGIFFLLMKIFKGIGTYEELHYLLSTLLFPIFIFIIFANSLITKLLGIIFGNPLPVYLTIITLIIVGAIIYYYLTLIIKEVGQFSTLKAVLCWIIPLALWGLLFLITFFNVSNITSSMEPLEYTLNGLFYDGTKIINVTFKDIESDKIHLSAYLEDNSLLSFKYKRLDEIKACDLSISSLDSSGNVFNTKKIVEKNCYSIANMLKSYAVQE